MTQQYTVRTDREGARSLRNLIEQSNNRSIVAGPDSAPPNGGRSALIIQTLSAIAGDDASQHDAMLMRLDGHTWTETGQIVQIRNISSTALDALTRYIAKPVSNLGLCVEASSATAPPLILPEPISYCCGTCLPQGSHAVNESISGAASYSFFAPNVQCCPSCSELLGDTAYPALSGQAIDLLFEEESSLYVSATADCGDTETVRWELDLAAETLVYRESTGAVLATWTAKRSPAQVLCPMKFELQSYNQACYVCGDEVCIKPSQFEPSTGCLGCDSAKEWPAFWNLLTGPISLNGATEEIVTRSTTWSLGDEERYWYVRRPDLAEAGDPVLMRSDLLIEGQSECVWWRTAAYLWFSDGHGAAVKLQTGCCSDANYVGHDSAFYDEGTFFVTEILSPASLFSGITDADLIAAYRPGSVQCSGYVTTPAGGGTNCANAFPTWQCFAKTVAWWWRLLGSGGNMQIDLNCRLDAVYRYQRTRTVADACGETRAAGIVAGSGGSYVFPPTDEVPSMNPIATWRATSICAETGAITLTLDTPTTATSFLSLPTEIIAIPSNAQEPPQQLVRRNCEEEIEDPDPPEEL